MKEQYLQLNGDAPAVQQRFYFSAAVMDEIFSVQVRQDKALLFPVVNYTAVQANELGVLL